MLRALGSSLKGTRHGVARVATSSAAAATAPQSVAAGGYFPPALLRMTDFVVDRAQGSWVYTTDGEKYLDFTTGIGVCSLGHCHKAVVQAVQSQAERILHGQLNCVAHKPALALIEALRQVLPESLDQYVFSNSGSEAVENAIKLARHATGRQNVVVMQGGFHGRTIGAGSLTTAKTFYRAGFQPMMPGVFVTPYAYCHRCPVKTRGGAPADDACCGYALEQLDLVFKQQTAPEETAAILFEPVLGEGGYVVPPASFVQGLAAKAKETGALLICDEVQSGFGRTGKLFAFEHVPDVVPDIVIMAKGIASGMPLSAIATSQEIVSKARPGSIGGTYAGNAVSCAAALAVLKTFAQENILQNVNERGVQLRSGLKALQAKYDGKIGDVRGLGLMLGMEFNSENVAAGTAGAISKRCVEDGLLVLTAGVYETLRFIPPLTVSKEEVDMALSTLDKVFAKVLQ